MLSIMHKSNKKPLILIESLFVLKMKILFFFRDPNVFSALENKRPLKSFKNIQPHKTDKSEKENRNSHVFVSSPYKTNEVHHSSIYNQQQQLKHVRQTFTTNKNNERLEVTYPNRPTMGGKTISSIHHLPASTTLHHNRMSSQELKLLSRRINPHEPLSSPHASPKKPPLPNLNRKRLLKEKENVVSEPKKKKAHCQFACIPCKKLYTTRAGFSYHKEKCKYFKLKSATPAIIHCVCQHPTEDTGTMIECIKCNRWLHLKCAGGVTKEESYCCPRCTQDNPTESDTIHLFNHLKQVPQEDAAEEEQFNGETIDLLALPEVTENGKDIAETFQELAKEQQNTAENYSFMSFFSEDNNMMLMSPQLPSAVVNDDFWSANTAEDLMTADFNSNTWCTEDLPSLLFSSDNNPSFVDEFSANDIPSSPIDQSDWLHFANFDDDFTSEL